VDFNWCVFSFSPKPTVSTSLLKIVASARPQDLHEKRIIEESRIQDKLERSFQIKCMHLL